MDGSTASVAVKKLLFLVNGIPGTLGTPLLEKLRASEHEVHSIQSRLEDHDALKDELARLKIPTGVDKAVLIPLAAITSLPECEKNPDLAWIINVTATAELAIQASHWAKQHGLDFYAVGISSSHVYREAPSPHRLTETDPTGPRSHYGRTKLGMEEALQTAAQTESFPCGILRVFGILGVDQPPHFLLPGLIRRAAAKDFSQ
ncbi:MAG: SDR family oxidoreductase, partial [Proteobacteria bacterium]